MDTRQAKSAVKRGKTHNVAVSEPFHAPLRVRSATTGKPIYQIMEALIAANFGAEIALLEKQQEVAAQ